MAQDSSTAEKSEKATAQKLKKSRQQGQVARSKDAVMAIGIFAALAVTVWLAPGYLVDLRRLFGWALADLGGTLADNASLDNAWSTLFSDAVWLMLRMVAPCCSCRWRCCWPPACRAAGPCRWRTCSPS